MNFFQHQDHARRSTRRLIALFILAVIVIIFTINLLVSVLVINHQSAALTYPGWQWPDWDWIKNNTSILVLSSLGALLSITLASLFKTASLSAGGGAVAKNIGGTLITGNTDNHQHRQLVNVVEEMAIASGLPVPEIYILEHETAMNAFAAGFTPSDAAIAVTQGLLDQLSRDELQSVVAHEFSHILNGDMRLNMRLMGVLFGILFIGMTGSMILRGNRYGMIRVRQDRSSGGGVAAILLIGFALMAIGYIGVFAGRLIKAAVSRQREFLADASAVQFTRQKHGLLNALVKIGTRQSGSRLRRAETEEISHMLFSNGVSSFASWLSTHPPLADRIRALDPAFDTRLLRAKRPVNEAGIPITENISSGFYSQTSALKEKKSSTSVYPRWRSGDIVSMIGNPGSEEIDNATCLHASIPKLLINATHNQETCEPLVYALALDPDGAIRSRQLAHITQKTDQKIAGLVESFGNELRALSPHLHIPLLEMSFPTLKRRPIEQFGNIIHMVNALIRLDDEVDVFEFSIVQILNTLYQDLDRPGSRNTGRQKLYRVKGELGLLFSVIASHGHETEATAEQAYQQGLNSLMPHIHWPNHRMPEKWVDATQVALEKLNSLPHMIKAELVSALFITVGYDDHLTLSELELMRAICASLRCPVPALLAPDVNQAGLAKPSA